MKRYTLVLMLFIVILCNSSIDILTQITNFISHITCFFIAASHMNYFSNKTELLSSSMTFLFMYDDHIVLLLIIVFFVWLNYFNRNFVNISLAVILTLTAIAWLFPLMAFFISLCFSIFYLFLLIPYFISNKFKSDVLSYVIRLLHSTGILEYFYCLFVCFFCQTPRMYKASIYISTFVIISLNIMTKLYVVLAPSLTNSYFFLYLILIFIFVVINYIRFLIGLSYMFTMMTITLTPNIVPSAILYIVTGDGSSGTPPEIPETTQTSKKNTYFSLFNIHKHQHNHYSKFINNSPRSYLYAGLAVGVVGAVGGMVMAYESIQQTKIAQEQLNVNTKTVDLALLEKKVITFEQYYGRHPEDRPPVSKL